MKAWFKDIAFTLVPLEFGLKDRFLGSPAPSRTSVTGP